MTAGDTRQDTQKAAGELQGAPDGIKGEKERGQTARQPGRTQQAGGAEDKRKEGREERGARMASRLGSGGGKRSTAAGRSDREKKRYDIFKGERREKNADETR